MGIFILREGKVTTNDIVLTLTYYALLNLIALVTPLLGTALIVGFTVSLFQATSSIQEQTLSSGLKLIAVFATMVMLGPWYLARMLDFFTYIYKNIPLFMIR